jgi:RPA family protein
MPENQKRQTAFKARISDIASGKYVKEEGWQPNYVVTQSGRKVSRVNLAAVVISPPTDETGFMNAQVDDGSGSISIRVFDNPKLLQGINIGDLLFVIGRPRQYGSETYVLAEIARKIEDKRWMELRKLELEKEGGKETGGEAVSIEDLKQEPKAEPQKPVETETITVEEEAISDTPPAAAETAEAEKPEEKAGPTLPEKVCALIKEMDSGSGADFEGIVAKAGENSEKIIKSLLMEGEIFEVSPGKLKVLE